MPWSSSVYKVMCLLHIFSDKSEYSFTFGNIPRWGHSIKSDDKNKHIWINVSKKTVKIISDILPIAISKYSSR